MPFLSNVQGRLMEKYYDGTIKIEYQFDFAKFDVDHRRDVSRQLFAGRVTARYRPGDTIDASYGFMDKNYSQEFRLTSPSDQRFRWQVGIYALHFLRNQYKAQSLNTLGVVPANSLEMFRGLARLRRRPPTVTSTTRRPISRRSQACSST